MIEYVAPEQESVELIEEIQTKDEGEFSSVTQACLKMLETCKHGPWYEKAYACPVVPFVCAPAAMVDGAKNINTASKKEKHC